MPAQCCIIIINVLEFFHLGIEITCGFIHDGFAQGFYMHMEIIFFPTENKVDNSISTMTGKVATMRLVLQHGA